MVGLSEQDQAGSAEAARAMPEAGESAIDEAQAPRESSSEVRAIAEALGRAVAGGLISPRDASLTAGRMGAKALPEGSSDSEALYGVTSRQGRNIMRQAAHTLEHLGVDPAAPVTSERSPGFLAPEPFALVEAELALSPVPHSADGARALDVLRWQRAGQPIQRPRSDGGPASATTRIRQYRYRHQLHSRIELLRANYVLSVGLPFSVVPMVLERRLLELVSPSQRRRGRPPDLEWLAAQVGALKHSYTERTGRSSDLAKVVLWGFGQYPNSPDPLLESEGLLTAALVAREAGGLGAYWMAERIRYLLGSRALLAIQSAHDSVIVLRNNGYWHESRALLDHSLAALERSNILDTDRSWLHQLLLGITPLFFTGNNPILDAETACRYIRLSSTFPYGFASDLWLPQTRRAEFEIEYTVARRRAQTARERFWLGPGALKALDAADTAMTHSDQPIYQAQWSLLKMRLGIDRRDTAEITSAARGYLGLANDVAWIARDHPSERRQYNVYRRIAITRNRWLERELPLLE